MELNYLENKDFMFLVRVTTGKEDIIQFLQVPRFCSTFMYLGTRFIICRKQNAYVEKYTDTTGSGEPLINPPVAKNMTDLGIFLIEMVLQCVLHCHWKAANCHCIQRRVYWLPVAQQKYFMEGTCSLIFC